MKIRNYALLFVLLLMFSACKKEASDPLTIPVDFTSTTYETLGTYNSSGTPNYLLPKDSVTPAMQSYIANTLVEKGDLRTTHPELLSSSAIADITITKSSTVFVTFVSQVTNNKNALAFYTYPTNNPPAVAKDIKTITYIFPSVGEGTTLQAGDKVKIGTFEVGTSIGLVLMRDAWLSATATLDNSAVHYCTNDVLNPEVKADLKKHAVLINYAPENKTLVGFENTNRTLKSCDNDFNDVVIYVTVTP